MRKTIGLICICVLLSGCGSKVYNVKEQKTHKESISKDAYLLSNQDLKTIDKSKHEKEKKVYYVESEEELAKVLQYAMEKRHAKVAYQSNRKIDLDKTSKLLTYFNPFDISLQLSTTEYKDGNDTLVYQSNVIAIKNLDVRFAQAESAAKRIHDSIITSDMDNDQKISAIHDYLVKHTRYNSEAAQDPSKNLDVFKAAGALVDRDAVCTGYARAFMMLAKLAGVPAMYVASDTMNHGWNLVYGNKGWRYIDVTWDDPVPDIPNRVITTFKDMSIEEFVREGTHIFDRDKSSEYYLSLAIEFFHTNE